MAQNIMLTTTVSMNTNPLERSIGSAKSELKSLNTALKAQQKAFNKTGMDAEQLAAKEKLLTRAIDKQKAEVAAKKAAYEKTTNAVKNSSSVTKKEQIAIDRSRSAYSKAQYELNGYESQLKQTSVQQIKLKNSTTGLDSEMAQQRNTTARAVSMFKQLGNETGALKAEYKGLGNQIRVHGQRLDKEKSSLKEIKATMGQTSTEYKQQAQVVDKLTDEQTQLINKQSKVASSMRNVQGSTQKATRDYAKMGDTWKRVGQNMTSVGQSMTAAVTLPVTLGLGMAIKKSMDFEGQMSKVGAVSGATGKQMRAMKDQAIDLGAKTSESASSVAEGMTEMAKKGFTANETMKAMPGVISAAEASGASMADTSNVMASAIRGFGLEASESGHVADVLAEAANKSSADIGDLGQTFKYVAPIAKTLGMSLEDTSAAAMVMSDSGIEAGQAGTSMRMSLLRMAKPTAKGKAEMDKLGISLTDAKGEFVGLPALIGQFQTGLKGMTKEQKLATISNVVGTEASSAFLTLIDAGPKKLNKYSKSLKDSDGASAKAAKQMKDNLKGSVEQLMGAMESLGLIIGESLTPFLRGLATAVSWVVDKISGMPKWIIMVATIMGLIAAAIGPVLVGLGLLVQAIGWIAASGPAMAIIGGIWTGIKVAAMALVGPIGWIVAGIALLTAGFIIAYKKSETFRNIVNGAIRGVVGAFQFLWNGIKTIGSAIGSFIMENILGPMIAFAQSIGNTLKAFWGQNGPMIIQAVQNIWGVVGPILSAMFNFFKTIFVGMVGIAGAYLRMIWLVASPILQAFSTSFMAVWNYIKLSFMNVWNVIKGVVQGALTVILGIVKIFGGLFTGDWSAVWSGLKMIVQGVVQAVVAVFRGLWTAIINIVGLFGTIFIAVWRGIWGALKGIVFGVMGIVVAIFKSIWNNLLAFLKFIGTVFLSVTRGIWNGIKFAIINPMRAASGGVKVILNGLKTFFVWIWGAIKNSVMWAVQGIGNVIRSTFSGINTFIRWIFNGIGNFIKWVWNSRILAPIRWVVQAINVVVRIAFAAIGHFIRWIFNGIASYIKWVWNGIKNSIMFYVNLIKRLVTAAWNILSRVTRAIFNGIKSFLIWVWKTIGVRVVNHVKALWNSIKYYWNIVSSFTRKIFNSVKNFMIWVWNNIKNRVVSIARSLWNTIRGVWNALASGTRKVFNSIRSFLTSLWNNIRNKVTSIVRSLWNGVRGTWNNLSNGTKRIFNGVRNYLVDKWNGIKNSVTGIASSLWASVRQTFTNMKNGLGGLADKIGGVITGMVKGIKKGLNSLIKGVNWVAKKLGVDQKIPELSTGTSGASYAGSGVGAGVSNGVVSSGGFATVNDRGPGNGTGSSGHQEVIQRANGTMVAPKGRDVTVPLGKGDIVHSGKAVQKAQKAGVLPKFSTGTNKKKKYDLLKDMKKNKNKGHHTDDINGNFFGPTGGGTISDLWKAGSGAAKESGKKAVVGTTKKAADTTKKGKEAVDTGKKVVEAAGKSAAKIGGDLLEYVGNPGKLVSAMLKKFGVDFGKVKGQIPKDMMWDPMWKGLKGGVKSLFDGWLTEADGAGDGGYIDLSKGINYGFGHPPGYPFGRHDGLDINYPSGSKLYSTLAGTANGITPDGSGFGNHMWINNGKGIEAIYGHMSKLAWKGKKKVKPGTYLGKSGGGLNDPGRGKSTGAHLHYEMRWNGKPKDPTDWLKKNNGSGGGKGKWKSTVKKALKMNGLPTSGKYVNAWLKQIETESGGNAKAMGGTDGLADGRAQGLVQVKPGTFNANKHKGHGNIMNGLDNLLAGIRYAHRKYGNGGLGVIGKGHGYAKGTDSARSGLANVFEKGGEIMNLRGGEQIIPNDVSINALKSMMSSDLFSRTQAAVYAGISRYAEALEQKQEQKRIKELKAQQQANANTTDINELKSMMGQMVYLMQQQLGVQEDIAGTNNAIANKSNVMDLEKTTQKVSEQEAFNLLMSRYNSGLKMN